MAAHGAFLELRPLWEAGVALGIGLLVGLEREHARAETATPHPHAKGARTFALIALFGYATALLGESFPALPLWALLALVVLLLVPHFERWRPDATGSSSDFLPHNEDITTEVAALLVGVIGMLVRHQLGVAVMLGILSACVLIAKPWMRQLVSKIRRAELLGTLQLLVALAIVLPVVPNQPLKLLPPLDGVINPRSVVLFVLLIATISYLGYFLTRILGARRGLSLLGLIGGVASSTAVTLAMAERARQNPSLTPTAAQAATLACAVMLPRILLVTAILHPPLAVRMILPATAAVTGYLVAYALIGRRRVQETPNEERELAIANPFELWPAIKFGLLYMVVVSVAKVARIYLGVSGLYLAAALSGLADVDPIVLASARMTQQGEEPLSVGAAAILLAAASNTFAKSGLAWFTGGRRYGTLVLIGHAAALVLGAATLFIILWKQ